MTPEDKDKIMKLINSFCIENDGQKITRWNATTLINSLNRDLEEIVKKDNEIRPNTAPPKKEKAI